MTRTNSEQPGEGNRPYFSVSDTSAIPAQTDVPNVCDRPVRHRGRLSTWMLEGQVDRGGQRQGPHGGEPEQSHHWLRVMCLTGVDYFSTLGYQPAIAFLAAGVISPFATVVLVLLTLGGALPVYRRIATESFRGEGSIAMLERLLPWWGGKLFVLALLGFAATDFMITITLSAADASAHLIENPISPSWLHGGQIPITVFLILLLGAVFLRGFREAIGVAVVLVTAYLTLNAIVIGDAILLVLQHPAYFANWQNALFANHANWVGIVAVSLLVFPKLALGLSGFETGVSVIPQIKGEPSDTPAAPFGRINGARRLMTTAAITMSVFLITSSFTTTLLIPAKDFAANGPANGRALAYLAHAHLGPVFGSVYDLSTIAILWFAGASAMAGLLNIVPRYLPRYGMAPGWAAAVRPLVLTFTVIALIITFAFQANVDAQSGAYATGVLVLMTSGSVAVTLSARRKRQFKRMAAFAVISVVFVYTTIANVVERPDGVRIAALFIVGIMAVSLASRLRRSFEIRATGIDFDEMSMQFLRDAAEYGEIHIVAIEHRRGDKERYREKIRQERQEAHIPFRISVMFLEVHKTDSSEFEEELHVRGVMRHGFRVLEVDSANIPNTIATVLLQIRNVTGVIPHIYFEWTESSPIANAFRFVISGEGEVAPATREVLREAEKDNRRRPVVHVN